MKQDHRFARLDYLGKFFGIVPHAVHRGIGGDIMNFAIINEQVFLAVCDFLET